MCGVLQLPVCVLGSPVPRSCHTGLWHLTEPKAAALSDPAAGNMPCFSQAELGGTTQFTEGFNGGEKTVYCLPLHHQYQRIREVEVELERSQTN